MLKKAHINEYSDNFEMLWYATNLLYIHSKSEISGIISYIM